MTGTGLCNLSLITINHMTPNVLHKSGRLIWHNGVIPASGIWIILGGGGERMRRRRSLPDELPGHDIAAPYSVSNTCVHVLRLVIAPLTCM